MERAEARIIPCDSFPLYFPRKQVWKQREQREMTGWRAEVAAISVTELFLSCTLYYSIQSQKLSYAAVYLPMLSARAESTILKYI